MPVYLDYRLAGPSLADLVAGLCPCGCGRPSAGLTAVHNGEHLSHDFVPYGQPEAIHEELVQLAVDSLARTFGRAVCRWEVRQTYCGTCESLYRHKSGRDTWQCGDCRSYHAIRAGTYLDAA